MPNKYNSQEQKFLQQLGERIRAIRIDRGLSQEELAFKADLDRTYIGSVERGERNISVLNLDRIMRALGSVVPDAFKPVKP